MPPSDSSKSVLKTSLPSAYAAVNAEQPHGYDSLPSKQEQDKYLSHRPGANAQHLGIALQHAHQIQAQKVAEEMILDRTVELISIPTSTSADPAAPSTEDARTFKSALFVFRPTDYDNLITERNYEDLCGYGLCPRENRKASKNAKGQTFHFKYGAKGSGPGGRGRSVDIVSREKLEKWCSDECAERALFIRVQLAEAPIWERRADDMRANNIELLEEARAKRQKQKQKQKQSQAADSSAASVTDGMSNLNIQEDRSEELAIERGDTAPTLRNGRIEVQIKEKENAGSSASAPQWKPEDATGGSIEGYVPQERRDQPTVQLDEKDLLDQI